MTNKPQIRPETEKEFDKKFKDQKIGIVPTDVSFTFTNACTKTIK